MDDKSTRGEAPGRGQDTDRIPKESILPIAIAGGAMLVCCLGPVLFVSGAAWFTGWLSGIDALGALAIAVAVGGAVFVLRRRRQASSGDDRPSAATQAIGEDR